MAKKTMIKEELVAVKYYAYNKPPFRPDATGYVPYSKLLPAFDERYMYWDKDDEPQARAGYMYVTTADGDKELYIVRASNVFTEVFLHESIAGGWAALYPGGGVTSAWEPTHIDCDGTMYIKHVWG